MTQIKFDRKKLRNSSKNALIDIIFRLLKIIEDEHRPEEKKGFIHRIFNRKKRGE